MKRIQEKVKDIVEVHDYEILQDFTSDPEKTLSAYHFTDATADLMAKWLDQVINALPGNGVTCALAGYRGVGKSHFLATLGAIVSQPEFRSRISDSHVSASAQTLKRRRYPTAFVKRGLSPTLIDELRQAVALTFEMPVAEIGSALPDILHFAARRAGELPFVLLIDTAFERTSRVVRDDGPTLGEIAALTKELNIFVGVALDDDISGADGVNSAIAANYKIDYLDQEHLYRIVDAHIFPKHRQMTQILHEIYTYFRGVLPAFRWSEQRFSALYPLHPIILETAPFVRLYVQDFALLSFTSEAGRKILGRPANSLIALDEVFDSVEATLRKAEDLKEAFIVFDRLNIEVVSQIPIMQRLQAKLILKALLLLSLEGSGTTASEVSAAMLIFDENDSCRAIQTVEDILERFAAAMPEGIQRVPQTGGENNYKFTIAGKDNLQNALTAAAQTVSPEIVNKILRRVAKDKFADWTLGDEAESGANNRMDSYAVWRGGLRRGRIIWDLDSETSLNEHKFDLSAELIDWEVIINRREIPFSVSENTETPRVFWQPAQLRSDEIETILRFHVLHTDVELRTEYGEQIRAAGHSHTVAVEKIWKRIFLQDGKVVFDGFDFNFTEEARAAPSLSEVFSSMLEPFFETRYPMHPYFARLLGMNEVSILVNDLFSGAHPNLQEVQQLAETFALPLGLVAPRGGVYTLETEERMVGLPLAAEILTLVRQHGEATVSLKDVYRQLKKTPNGLVREAQHLILTALVAQRQIEFVTSKGDRINRRSLDLKIIWDDIEGIAKPSGTIYSERRLTEWAKILTGNENLHTLETPADRETVRQSLKHWLTDWESAHLLERFNELGDEILNTKIWRLAVHAEKTFGSVAETVRNLATDAISVDESLHRVADAFSNSDEHFFNCTGDLVVIEDFISGAAKRQEITSYLAICEPTGEQKIEVLRENLFETIEQSRAQPSEVLNSSMYHLWENFHLEFSDHYAKTHDSVMKSHRLQEKVEKILNSREWFEFESLSACPIFPQNFRLEVTGINRRLKHFNCRDEVRETLKFRPFCSCDFNLSDTEMWENLPQKLWEAVNHGLFSFRRGLLLTSEALKPIIEKFAASTQETAFISAAEHLLAMLSRQAEFTALTDQEIFILQKVLQSIDDTPLAHLKFPSTADFLPREQLREKINSWLDELPDKPAKMRV